MFVDIGNLLLYLGAISHFWWRCVFRRVLEGKSEARCSNPCPTSLYVPAVASLMRF